MMDWKRRMRPMALVGMVVAVHAGEPVKVKLGGRLFMDGGLFIKSPYPSEGRAEITDVRLTGKVTLPDDWYTKIDVGFAGNKVSLKDAFVQKRQDCHLFRFGYMLSMCSLDQSSSTNDFVFLTGANAAETFYLGRRVGVSYTCLLDKYYVSAGVFCGDGLNRDEKVRPGYNATLRGVYRPLNERGNLLHLGAGGLLRRPDRKADAQHGSVSFSSNGVSYLSVPPVTGVSLDDVRNTFQWNVEAVYLARRVFLQTEYLNMNVARAQGVGYHPWGAYVEGGVLLRGNYFGYDEWDALPLTPEEKGALLLSGRFNVTHLDDGAVRGGVQKDLTLGLNYYATDYLTVKLDGSLLWTKDKEGSSDSFGVVQARLQLRF